MDWSYTALNRMAREVKGIEPGPWHEASSRLKARGLEVIFFYPDPASLWLFFGVRKAVSHVALAVFFKDLSNMLSTGLTLRSAFYTLEETVRERSLALACRRIALEVEGGQGLARAFASSGNFPRLALCALSAGERSGNISQVLELLSEHYKLLSEIKRKMLCALGYPFVVAVSLIGAFGYAVVYVVPQLLPLLPEGAMSGRLTHIILTVCAFVQTSWPFLIICTLGLALGFLILRRQYPLEVQKVWASFPLIGSLKKDLELSVLFFNLFILQKSGIPIESALREVGAGSDAEMRSRLEQCRKFLAGGLPLSEAYAQDAFFPRIVRDTVRLGEETGRYEEYFERLFQYFYRSFCSRLDTLTGMVQPALLFLSAFFIAAFALGILQPIYGNLTNVGVVQP